MSGDEKAQSKLIRPTKGSFQFIARQSSPQTILLDTPFARIRNVTPGALFGSFVFGVLTLALIDELKAASSDLALLDDETITYKDIKHGVFVVVTKEATPRVIVVDDPGESVVIRSNGTAASIEHVPNSLSQMAQIENAYEGVATINAVGKQDPFFPQFQQGANPNEHANAQPQSAPSGGTGSSTPPNQLNAAPQLIQENTGVQLANNTQSGIERRDAVRDWDCDGDGGGQLTSSWDAETGTGETVLQGISTINGYVALDGGRELQNRGTLTWVSSYFELGYNPYGTSIGGGTLDNAAGATFLIESDQNIYANSGTTLVHQRGPAHQIRDGTTGTTTIEVGFDNTGTANVETGTLALDMAGTSALSAFTVASIGPTLAFVGGRRRPHRWGHARQRHVGGHGRTVDISGGGTSAAACSGGHERHVECGRERSHRAGPFQQSGGTLSGTGTVTATSV